MSRHTILQLIKIEKGAALVTVLVFASIFSILVVAGAGYVIDQTKLANQRIDKERAYHLAEAGVNYYRWHLAHVPDDFQDGTGGPGPYVHDYRDATGSVIGQYSLNITPPQSGSTIVTIESTGWTTNRPNVKRKLVAQIGIPSFTKYAVVANDVMRFGSGTEVFGPIHSNNGIRFDALAHNVVTSTKDQYDDPDHTGVQEFGVHTHRAPVDPYPPNPVPIRTDVFEAGRQFPVPQVDFNGITADLANLKQLAIGNGIYLSPSGVQGYHIKFNQNQTVDIRTVSTQKTCQYCYFFCWQPSRWTNYANIFSINQESAFTYQGVSSLGLPMPTNGVIFVEDDVWVDGQINGSRVTVVAAREPLASASATIIVNNDLLYTNYDGTDAIGLIAQTNVSAGFYSEDYLQIDAALIAQKGRVGRYYYPNRSSAQQNPAGCAANVYRQELTLNGAIATNQRYGFAYTDGTGYQIRNLNFDQNLTFAPPPYFPTTGQYTLISLEEQ